MSLIKDVLTNPDGLSYSSKRVAGWLTLIVFLTYVVSKEKPDSDAMFTLAGMTFTFFGLTSIDYKTIVNNKIETGDTSPAKV